MFQVQLQADVTTKKNNGLTTVSKVEDLGGAEDAKSLFELVSSAFQNIARVALSTEQNKGTFPKDDKEYRTVVDGKSYDRGNDLSNAIKEVVFTRKRDLAEILVAVAQRLDDRSRIDTGQYKRNHALIHNNKVVVVSSDGSLADAVSSWTRTGPTIKEKDMLRFVNMTPYAGMLEREGHSGSGSNYKPNAYRFRKANKVSKGSNLYVRQPNGAYYLVSRAVDRLFGKNSIIKFEWANGGSIPGINSKQFKNQRGYVQSGALGTRKNPKKKLKPYAYPSIVIYVKSGGLL